VKFPFNLWGIQGFDTLEMVRVQQRSGYFSLKESKTINTEAENAVQNLLNEVFSPELEMAA
jgi:hypothetical protein